MEWISLLKNLFGISPIRKGEYTSLYRWHRSLLLSPHFLIFNNQQNVHSNCRLLHANVPLMVILPQLWDSRLFRSTARTGKADKESNL